MTDRMTLSESLTRILETFSQRKLSFDDLFNELKVSGQLCSLYPLGGRHGYSSWYIHALAQCGYVEYVPREMKYKITREGRALLRTLKNGKKKRESVLSIFREVWD